MAHDDDRRRGRAGDPSLTLDARRREQLEQLKQRRTALSPAEIDVLGECFGLLIEEHHDRIWNRLRRRLPSHAVDEVAQDAHLAVFRFLCDNGFTPDLAQTVHRLTRGALSNHLRIQSRIKETAGLPSSGSEQPRSGPDPARDDLAHQLFDALPPAQQEVVQAVFIDQLTREEAAALFGVPLGTMKSRVSAAKAALRDLLASLETPSERGKP